MSLSLVESYERFPVEISELQHACAQGKGRKPVLQHNPGGLHDGTEPVPHGVQEELRSADRDPRVLASVLRQHDGHRRFGRHPVQGYQQGSVRL